MIICQNEDGTWGEYEEPYTTVDFKTEEDYKKFEEILNYYNNRTEHDKEVRNKAIDDFESKLIMHLSDWKLSEAPFNDDETDRTRETICETIENAIGAVEEIAEQLKEGGAE